MTDATPGAPMPAPDTAKRWMIEMVGVHKWFGEFHVLKDINLNVDRGERIVVWAPRARANRP